FKEEKISYILNINTSDYIPNIYLDDKYIFGVYSGKQDSIYILDIYDINKKDTDITYSIFESFVMSNFKKFGYNIKQDILFFFNNNLMNVKCFNYDLMIAYYLMNPSRSNYLMDYILNDLFEVNIEKENKNTQKQLSLFEENT